MSYMHSKQKAKTHFHISILSSQFIIGRNSLNFTALDKR